MEIAKNIETLKAEVLILAEQQAQNILAMGEKLRQIREQLPHGAWDVWVQDNLPFTRRWANQYIKCFEAFGNSSSHLPLKKMTELLALPEEHRTEFIEFHSVEDMSVRQLREAIKAQKQAESERDTVKSQAESIARELREIKAQPPKVEIKTEIKTIIPEDYEQAKRRVQELEREANEAQRKQHEAEEKQRAEHVRLMRYDEERRKAQDELFQMKKAMASSGGSSSDEYNPLNFSQFWMACKSFLDRVSPLTYMHEELSKMDGETKQDYFKWLAMIEKWTWNMKDALNGVTIEGEILQ